MEVTLSKRFQRLPVEFYITQHAVFNNVLTPKHCFGIFVLEKRRFPQPAIRWDLRTS